MTLGLSKSTFWSFPSHPIIATSFLFCLLVMGCSRSPWMKADGHEVPPSEQLECVQEVNRASEGEVLGQDILEQRIEQCMLDRGYHRRPWWLMNDLHWHIKEPAY